TRGSLSASGRAASPGTIRTGGPQRFFGTQRTNVSRAPSFEHETASLRQTMQQNHVGGIPAGGRVNAGEFGGMRGANGAGNTMKPSAGTFSNPGTLSNRGTLPNRGATPGSSPISRPSLGNSGVGNSGVRAGGNVPSSIENGNRGGFRPFTPPPTGGTRPS